MKKLLPTKGFTLVELLVVITVIAILSAIGLAVFNGVQPRARNDARRADLGSISKALEVNKTNSSYVALADSQFATGKIPLKDPQGLVYCGNVTVNSTPSDITAVPTASVCTPSADYSPISTTVPVPAAGATSWKICTWLESEGGNPAGVYCIKSAQ